MKTKWHFSRWRWLLFLTLTTWLPFITSCACYVPVPTLNENRGRRMQREEVCFIQPGRTSRAEVYAQLGTNCVSLPKERAIAYSWECKGVSFSWYFVINGLYSGKAYWLTAQIGIITLLHRSVESVHIKMADDPKHCRGRLPPALEILKSCRVCLEGL